MARIDYSQLIISNLIIHEIPKHKMGETGTPIYSEAESTITDGLRTFFQDKIKAALNSDQSFKVCFRNETDSCVPTSILSLYSNEDNFITESKNIATNLFNIQKGNNAAGILLLIKGNIQTKTIYVILKVERDNGAQLVLNEETKSFDIAEVRDLMLTRKTKIFKVALLVQRDDFRVDFDGLFMDYQINIKDKKGTNSFFLDFMGCYPYNDPKIATKNFYNFTKEYIGTIQDPVVKAKYTQDLNSYLQCNQNTISPNEFAEIYMLETSHKNQYRDFLINKGFAYETYTKDNVLINSHIQKILLEFANGLSILGTKGSLKDVDLSQDSETEICTATITSKIKNIK